MKAKLRKKELQKKAKESEKRSEKRVLFMLKIITVIAVLYLFYLLATRAWHDPLGWYPGRPLHHSHP